MPTYDYLCPENGRTETVFHAMSTRVATWGELCELASIDVGSTAPESPVERQMGTGMLRRSASSDDDMGMDTCCSGPQCDC